MNEMVLLESLSLRQQLCTNKNTSILGKVGHLIFLSGTTFCTTQALALFIRQRKMKKVVMGKQIPQC